MATEFARVSGSYSTAYIGRYDVLSQNISGNYTTFRLYGIFYYGGGTSVGSSYSTFTLHTSTIKSGSYRYYPGDTQLGYVDINVGHNNDGTFPSTYIGISASSYHMSGSAGGYLSAPTIPRQANITGYNDFNDEQSPKITYNNPGGFRINARLEFAGTNIRRDNISNTGSYTFSLTDAERKLLRQKCTSNSMTVRGVIATCIGGTTENYWSYWDRTMTIVNGNPTFENFNFEDTGTTTTALTGDPNAIIKGYSNVSVTIPSSMKATAKKEATMSKYRAVSGTGSTDIPYSETLQVGGRLISSESIISVYAIDSRSNSTMVSKAIASFINYTEVTKGSITVNRSNGVSESTNLKINGTYHAVNFGKVTNTIKTAQYRYKVTNSSTWSDYQDFTINTSTSGENGSFSFDGLIKGDTDEGFNIENSYNLEVLIKDELSSVTFTANIGSGIPNIALAKNGVGIMGKYDEDVGGNLQINGEPVLMPYTLYSNESGSDGTITLSDSVVNYSCLTIVYRDNDGYIYSRKLYNPNDKITTLFAGQPMISSLLYSYLKLTSFYISGTTISIKQTRYKEVTLQASTDVKVASNIFITRIIGYK